jgi:hypothetical protein
MSVAWRFLKIEWMRPAGQRAQSSAPAVIRLLREAALSFQLFRDGRKVKRTGLSARPWAGQMPAVSRLIHRVVMWHDDKGGVTPRCLSLACAAGRHRAAEKTDGLEDAVVEVSDKGEEAFRNKEADKKS